MKTPRHIAFIMDGNGRWATAQGRSRMEGHKAGVEALYKLLPALADKGVKYATFYAFSSENWGRPEEEVKGLMALAELVFKKELKKLIKEGVRLKFLGDFSKESKVSKGMRKIIREAEMQTAENTKLHVNICFNYGGQQELLNAAQKLAQKVEEGSLKAADISADMFESELYTADQPNPDLMIRTSGEQRLSNFLPWQLSYSEFYFTDDYWPDFDEEALNKALDKFGNRERRFGLVS